MLTKTITIDGVEYVQKSEVKGNSAPAVSTEGLPYVIVRTYSAGVFAGFLKSRNGQEGIVLNARRLWYWDGAASLSQLSLEGVKKPQTCKFPQEVPSVELTQIIEVLPCTEEAKDSIASVSDWKE